MKDTQFFKHQAVSNANFIWVNRFVIERQSLDGRKKEQVVTSAVLNVEGLAVDWMGRNIYWTDEVMPAEGKGFFTLIFNNTFLDLLCSFVAIEIIQTYPLV